MDEEAKKHGIKLQHGEAVGEPQEGQGNVVKKAIDNGLVLSQDDTTESDKDNLKKLAQEEGQIGGGEGGFNAEKAAGDLYKSMKGAGTREETIFSVFSKLKGKKDLEELKMNFGGFGGRKSPLDEEELRKVGKGKHALGVWLKDELKSYELEKLNDILSKKGIEYKF